MTEAAPKRPQVRRPKAPATALPAAASQGTEPAAAIDLGLLTEAVGFLLKRAQMAVFNDFNRTFADADIRPAQFSVLAVIGRNPGLKQSEVSGALSIKRTNFVPLLDSLEERGLVKRKLAAADRRSHALHLTAKGAVLVKELNALWARHEQRIRDQIGEEGRTRLLELLGRLVELGGPDLADDADAAEVPPVTPRKPRAPRAPKAPLP